MNEIAKHKVAIEDADTQNKVCNFFGRIYISESLNSTLHTSDGANLSALLLIKCSSNLC